MSTARDAHGGLLLQRQRELQPAGAVQQQAAGRRSPGVDGDGERPVLLAEALPVALHGDVAAEPADASLLVRLPLQGPPDARDGTRPKGWRAIS